MVARGFNHASPLDPALAIGSQSVQDEFVDSIADQEALLRRKGCDCDV